MSAEMSALRLHSRGGAEAIVFDTDVAVPQPGLGDVLVRVAAASITPTELGWPSTWVDRAGVERVPVIPGHEVCGEVVEIGYGTFGFEPGDEVFGITDWYRDGAAAQYVAAEARNLARKPASCNAAEAAALALPGLTALQALFELGGLEKGGTVLMPGATGGVGAIATQLAHNAGAGVVAVGHADRAGAAHELGAADFVDIGDSEALRALPTVDLVLDLVGGEARDALLEHVSTRRVVSIVEPHAGVDYFIVEARRSQLEELAQLADDGALRSIIADVVPLSDGARAFTERPRAPGKRVLEVSK